MSLGFIIPSCCRNEVHFKQLCRCVLSIRKFHTDEMIILIDDSDCDYNVRINEHFGKDDRVVVKNSICKGSADQQVFKVLSDTELFTTCVFLQDSMLLNKKLVDTHNVDVQFIWHFTNHIVDWDRIHEPITEYNQTYNIKTHTDLLKHVISRDYGEYEDFQKFAINCLNNKDQWCGSIGSCCVLSKECLKTICNKINFVDIFVKCNTNRYRRCNESIFPIICHFVFPNKQFEQSYDGLYYDGVNHGGNRTFVNKPTGFDNLRWCAVHEYFSKISFNR